GNRIGFLTEVNRCRLKNLKSVFADFDSTPVTACAFMENIQGTVRGGVMVTYFVVQAFQKGKKGVLIADEPRQARDEGHCKDLAERLSEGASAVVAFSRRGDPASGDWEDAVILAQFGHVPDEL